MKEKIMCWNYKKAFVTLVTLAVVLALVSAIAVPAEPVAADPRRAYMGADHKD